MELVLSNEHSGNDAAGDGFHSIKLRPEMRVLCGIPRLANSARRGASHRLALLPWRTREKSGEPAWLAHFRSWDIARARKPRN